MRLSSGVLRWQDRGSYLELDSFTNCIHLVHEIECAPTYIPFKAIITDLMQVADEWRDVLEGLRYARIRL